MIWKNFSAFTLVIFIFGTSCSQTVRDVEFYLPERPSIVLKHPGNIFSGFDETIFVLTKPVAIRENQGIGIDFVLNPGMNTGPVIIELFSSAMVRSKDYSIPLSTHEIQLPGLSSGDRRSLRGIIVPVSGNTTNPPGGLDIGAFRIHSGDFLLSGIQLLERETTKLGIHTSRNGISVSEGYQYNETILSTGNSGFTASHDVYLPDTSTSHGIRMDYSYQPSENRLTIVPGQTPVLPEIEILIDPESGHGKSPQSFLLRLHPGDHSVTIHNPILGFNPGNFRIVSKEEGFVPRGFSLVDQLEPIAPWNSAEILENRLPAPILSDLGSLLRYPTPAWRQTDFEIFAWDVHPEILVLDFRNRAVQSRFLGRLAFFVEKRGFTGTLLTNSELSNRHDWNAHNYRSIGLADFFNASEKQNFILNPEELYLMELVSNAGIIKRNTRGNTWEPGIGGIISLTRDPRESGASRSLFMTHEALHGIYYLNPRLVQQSQSEWQNLSPEVREYLKMYFGYLQYETKDEYLMENEFQAYMLQQPLQEVRWVFGTRYRDRLISAYPHLEDFFRRTAPLAATEFYNAAFRLQSLVFADYGFLGGDIQAIRPSS